MTEARRVGKPGLGQADIVTSAGYAPTCANPKTCNKPDWTKDARGAVTEYDYDPGHGGLSKVTLPASTPNAVRPQTRFVYETRQAYYKDSSGNVVASGQNVTLLASTSACRTQASCAGSPDEVKTIVSYGPQTAGTANNLLPASVSSGAGDNSLTATTGFAYDPIGNLVTVDGPLSGADDSIRMRYDAARRIVGSVSPDPDGNGSLKPRAERITYNADGQPTKVETGNVDGPSDAQWAAFTAHEAVETEYDADARPVEQRLVAGGTIHALTQTRYDAVGRPECLAQRMNKTIFATISTDACSLGTQGTGADDFGPDRIAKTIYDDAGRMTNVKSALGTADVADEVTTTYTGNGLVQTVTDGENNKTTYEYDGHDRLLNTRYPVAAKGAGVSAPTSGPTADFEQLGHDPNGNVVSFRNRAGQTIGFTYDALDRLTFKDRPDAEPDVTYGYDLLGQMLSAGQPGHVLGFTYDALGRNLKQEGPLGAVFSEYDLAGRRTRLTWPDTFYVTYDYLVTGEMTKIRENGAVSGLGVLASFTYDQLGRRTSLVRGNGAVTGYAYDPVSRLQQLSHDLGGSGTTRDSTSTFTYNPASQIHSLHRTNDAYAWTAHGSGTTSTTADGRNRIANGVNPLGYDAKGNIVTNGTYTFGYSSENLMTTLTNPVGTQQHWSTYAYDPLMRLAAIDSSNSVLDAQLGYDGLEVIYEGLSNNRTRRYVHGPGVDEPLAAYLITSTGTSRSWFHADERGSVLIQTYDANAAPNLMGSYDEYGVGIGSGRFHYTGQYQLADAGLHYYRSRIYDPKLGRFLQPDPIGYSGGMNLYAYVGGDPVNFSDPLGLQRDPVQPVCYPGDTCVNGPYLTRYTSADLSGFDAGQFQANSDIEVNGPPLPDIIVTAPSKASKRFCGIVCRIKRAFGFRDDFSGGGGDFGGGGASLDYACGCLEKGTLVSAPEGLRAIEELEVGDLVLSLNEQTGEIAPKPVTDLIRPQPKPLYALASLDAGGEAETFHATDDHPWKVEGKGWVQTINLKAGDRIDTGLGVHITVTSLTLTDRVENTYNLTVADWHTFMVGEDRAIVHNTSLCDRAAELAKELRRNHVFVRGPGGKVYKYDLSGAPHFDKSTRTWVKTPHMKAGQYHYGPNGHRNVVWGPTRPMTEADLRVVNRALGR